jgi:hypothetical protein
LHFYLTFSIISPAITADYSLFTILGLHFNADDHNHDDDGDYLYVSSLERPHPSPPSSLPHYSLQLVPHSIPIDPAVATSVIQTDPSIRP